MLRALAKAKRARKAQMREFLVAVIILLFSAAIIFIFIEMARLGEVSGKQACRQSVELRSEKIAEGLAAAGITEVPLNCKTEPITISTTNEEEIKEKIANAMQECWWMLGEGQLVFFTDLKERSHCLICSTIEFDEKVQKKIKQVEMLEYLSTTVIPGKNLTYLEYLSGANQPLQLQSEQKFNIDTSKKYAVLFITGKSDVLEGYLKTTAGGIAGAAVGGAGGAVAGLGLYLTTLLFILPGAQVIAAGAIIGGFAGGLVGAYFGNVWAKATGEYASIVTLLPINDKAEVEKVCDRIETIP
jgi:predicted nucleic acid-binding Zn ribbon protein